nr:hypothetical protein [Tanacetum cinerariifolium]
MGDDKNGTTKMYRLGVCASDAWDVVPSRSARRRDKVQWKSTVERLSNELAEYKAREAQRQGTSDNDSHVMGDDKNGTIKMYRLGVCASDAWDVVPSRFARRRDKVQWKSNVERLSNELAEYKAREAQRQGTSDNDSHGTNVPCTSTQGPHCCQ